MPGPFPGMDPYLEHPDCWPGVQHWFVTFTGALLNRHLPERYYAEVEERVYLVQPGREIVPDVAVSRRQPGRTTQNGPVVVLERAEPWRIHLEQREVREPCVVVRSREHGDALVATLEFLSPSNKAPGSRGRELYQRKQRELLRSRTSLIEIGLLRGGAHTITVPLDCLDWRGDWDYLVCRHRGGRQPDFEVWPILLPARPPVIPVPLSNGDPDVELDLQAVLDRVYDEGAFSRKLDYTQEPKPPLPASYQEWAYGLLLAKGLREQPAETG